MHVLLHEILPSLGGTAMTMLLVTPWITGWYEAKIAAILATVRGLNQKGGCEDASDW